MKILVNVKELQKARISTPSWGIFFNSKLLGTKQKHSTTCNIKKVMYSIRFRYNRNL